MYGIIDHIAIAIPFVGAVIFAVIGIWGCRR